MSRKSTGIKSSNINLDFECGNDVVLISKGGSIHIIGGFKPNNTANTVFTQFRKKEESSESLKGRQVEDQVKQSQVDTSRQQEKPITLRRSSRVRNVVAVESSSKNIKKQKQALKKMANYFDCGDIDDDDEQDSYSEKNEQISSQSQSQDSSRMQEECSQDYRFGRKKKNVNIQEKKIVGQNLQKRESGIKQCVEFGDFSVPTKNPYE